MGAAVRRNFSNRGPQAGADGEEAAADGRCDGGPAGGPGRNRHTVQRSLRWLSRTAVRWGPRFCSTAPRQEPPPLTSSVPSVGPAQRVRDDSEKIRLNYELITSAGT
jgi:hypothetical protein